MARRGGHTARTRPQHSSTLPGLARYAGKRIDQAPAVLAVLSAAALIVWGIWLSSHVPEPHRYGSLAQDWVSATALIVLPWLVGLGMTHRDRRADAYRRLTEQLIPTKSEYERFVARSQRMEICTELDELMAHSIAAIALQAAGARRLMDNPIYLSSASWGFRG
jgi:hypothetical protein